MAEQRDLANAGDPESDSAALFTSYRDLYFDEQVRREEKLATAGTRLKERLASLAQRKEQRRTILDPKLGLAKRKGGSRRVGPVGRAQWSQREYRPKSLAEKARIKAGSIAFAYDPPRATRLGTSTTKYAMETSPGKPVVPPTRPSFKEEGYVESRRPSSASRPSQDSSSSLKRKSPYSDPVFRSRIPDLPEIGSSSSSSQMRFVDRTITVPVKSSMDRPYRMQNGKLSLAPHPPAGQQRSMLPQTSPPSSDTDSGALSPPADAPPAPRREIPGIRRKPMPVKPKPPEETVVLSEPLVSAASGSRPGILPPSSVLGAGNATVQSPQSALSPGLAGPTASHSAFSASKPTRLTTHPASGTALPMMAPPRRPTMPSLFIPRKRNKPS